MTQTKKEKGGKKQAGKYLMMRNNTAKCCEYWMFS